MPLLLGAAVALASSAATAQRLAGSELVGALQQGGFVLVMRNAQSEEEPPPPEEQAPGNVHGEREINQHGQGQMGALSYVFRELSIPVGESLTSPAYRSVQTANYFGFGERRAVEALASDGGDPAWLERRVMQPPSEGLNTVVTTHGSVVADAFGDLASELAPGEMLIFRPGGDSPDLVARLTVEQWARMAVDQGTADP